MLKEKSSFYFKSAHKETSIKGFLKFPYIKLMKFIDNIQNKAQDNADNDTG
jgi:hypothetical protein